MAGRKGFFYGWVVLLVAWVLYGFGIYYWTLGPLNSVITLMGARVQKGPPFVVTARDTILQGPYRPFDWDLHPDGDRFVVTRRVTSASAQTDGTASPERFLVVVNWFEELKARMGSN